MMRYPHLLSVIRAILLLLLGLYVAANALPCEDSRCRTASCNDDGGCICDIPDPSTVLDGDRLFLGYVKELLRTWSVMTSPLFV